MKYAAIQIHDRIFNCLGALHPKCVVAYLLNLKNKQVVVVIENRKVVSLFGILATHPYNTRSKNKLIMAGQELDASIIDPPREVEESEVVLKEELHKMKHQMAKMYQA